MLPEVGQHLARVCDTVIVADRANENPPAVGLQIWLPCEVVEGESKGRRITAIRTLVNKDGGIQINEWTRLQEIFGTYTMPTEMFSDAEDHSDKRFEIDVQDEEWNGKVSRKVKWLNLLGGGGGIRMPAPANPAAVLAKYGSMFRAVSGGTPVRTPPGPKPVPASPSKAPSPKTPRGNLPARTASATMEQCWAALCKEYPDKSETETTDLWFRLMRENFGHENNSDVKPEEWAKLLDFITDDIPF